MKTRATKKALTFGELVQSFYRAHGHRRAKGILQLAVKAHLVVFRGCNHWVLSGGNQEA
jgi:hypothetical protein